MSVPIHRLNPLAGGWPLTEAAILWAWLSYDIPPTAPETSEVKLIRRQARSEVREVATVAPPGTLPPPPVVRRVKRDWPTSDHPQWASTRRTLTPSAPDDPDPNWVTVEALRALAERHGIPYGSAPTALLVAPVAPASEQGPVSKTELAKGERGRFEKEAEPVLLEILDEMRRQREQGRKASPTDCIKRVLDQLLPLPPLGRTREEMDARKAAIDERNRLVESYQAKVKPYALKKKPHLLARSLPGWSPP